jgi:DNA-binding transcriptional MerR regulator
MSSKISIDPYWGAPSSVENFMKLADFLFEERFIVKDLDVSYVNITYWDKQGILNSSRTEKGKWRNFNFIDYMWLKTIHELREIGVSTALIKKAMVMLFAPYDFKRDLSFLKNNPEWWQDYLNDFSEEEQEQLKENKSELENSPLNERVSNFFIAIFKAIQLKHIIKLEIFKDGYTIIHPDAVFYSEEDMERMTHESHVSISLTQLLKTFLVENNQESIHLLKESQRLQPNEIALLEMIHKGEYDSINIIFKDKKIKEFELSKTQEAKSKMIDILKEGKYQDITIKSHNGMVTQIQNTVKVKV